MSFPISIDQKGETYDASLVIIDLFTKIVHYELIKTIIDVVNLTEIIINMAI